MKTATLRSFANNSKTLSPTEICLEIKLKDHKKPFSLYALFVLVLQNLVDLQRFENLVKVLYYYGQKNATLDSFANNLKTTHPTKISSKRKL